MPTLGPRIIPNVIDAHVRYLMFGQKCENVFSFSYAATPTVAQLNQLASELQSTIMPKMQAFMHSNCAFTEILVADIGAAGRPFVQVPIATGTVGTRGTSPAPNNAAASLALRSGFAGRSNRGRKSFSGFVTTDISATALNTGLQALLLSLASEMMLKRVSNLFTPCIPSLKTHTSKPLLGVLLLDNALDSQKTRLVGHGV